MSDGGVEPSEAGSDSFLVADGYLSDLEGIHAEEENASQEAAAVQMGTSFHFTPDVTCVWYVSTVFGVFCSPEVMPLSVSDPRIGSYI